MHFFPLQFFKNPIQFFLSDKLFLLAKVAYYSRILEEFQSEFQSEFQLKAMIIIFLFYVHNLDRISELRCQDKNCKDKKKEWGLLDHTFNEKNKTLNLYLDTSFHYTRPYLFKLCYNSKFKSQLTLRFNVTKILEGKILNVEADKLKKTKKVLIEVPNLCKNLGKNKTIHPAMFVLSNGNRGWVSKFATGL